MEAIAAFSLACNVIQVVSFAHETISLCKKLHRGESVDRGLANNASHLSELSTNLRDSLNAARTVKYLTKEQNDLQAIAERCLEASTDLQNELNKLTPQGSSSVRNTLRNVIRAQFRKKEIDKLRMMMNECQDVLHSRLLFQLWDSNEISMLEQRNDWQKLDKDVRLSIERNVEEQRKMLELVSVESTSTRLQISDEAKITREHVTTRIQQLNHNAALEKQCDRLIGSLKYNDMNARRNQITDSHEDTFQWIFDNIELQRTVFNGVKRPWDNFTEWLKSGEKIYWINGKAGSGKSTLMKFIIDDARTKNALKTWHPEISLIVAFVWSAGQPMQCSLKGILCSLLHQIFGSQRLMAADLSTEVPIIYQKDTHSDWSVQELKIILFKGLEHYSRSVCIFLDGLDEISQTEGTFDLVDLIERLIELPNVKICVSSRPERYLELSLSKYPSLRLQDLTAYDIRCYVTDFLGKFSDRIGKNQDSSEKLLDLINLIIEKADGVFLWVHLALSSLRRGLSNGDEWDKLTTRLDMLPSDLQQLYKNMWLRLNEDEEIYRVEAAYYFNMAIEAMSGLRKGDVHGDDGPLSLFEFTVLTNDNLQRAFLEDKDPPSKEKLEGMCKALRISVEVRCAGLLEFSPISTEDLLDDEMEKISARGDEDENQGRIFKLDFIHRTARDFLLQTEDGQAILLHDSMSIEHRYIRVIKTKLVNIIWTNSVYGLSLFMSTLRQDERPISKPHEQELLHIYEKLCIQGYLIPDRHPHDPFRPGARVRQSGDDFLGMAAMFGCVDLIKSKLANTQVTAKYKTYLLHRASSWSGDSQAHFTRTSESFIQTNGELITWLLDHGADPNARMYNPFYKFQFKNSFQILLDTSTLSRSDWQQAFVNFVEIYLQHPVDLTTVTYLPVFDEYGLPWDNTMWTSGYIDRWNQWIRVALIEVNTAQLLSMVIAIFKRCDLGHQSVVDSWMERIRGQCFRKVLLVGRSGLPEKKQPRYKTVTDNQSGYILDAIDKLHETLDRPEDVDERNMLKKEVGRRMDESFDIGEEVDPEEFLRKKHLMASKKDIEESLPKMFP